MLKRTLLVLAVLSYAALIAYRAYIIPVTHDEASTWLNYKDLNLWTCISNASCWGTANNHWLNSLLMQWSTALFGVEAWALRLPNILAGIAYCICAALICDRYLRNYALSLAGFFLLCSHVYLLDFFSLARGYGMMTCGVIWGIYGLLRYIEKWERKWLIVSISALVIGILGNFTGLISWASLGLGWFICVLVGRKYNFILRHGVYWLGSAVLLFLLLYFPIKTLAGSGEFAWGAPTIFAMGTDLMQSLLYGVRYFGDDTYRYALFVAMGLVFIFLLLSLLVRNKETKYPLMLMILLLCLNVLIIFLQQTLTGSHAPIGRKSIFLIPFLFGVFVLGLSLLRNTGTASFIGIIISLAFIGHTLRTLNARSVREWYYDAYYPELISTILPEGASSDSVRLGTTWIFNPAMSFYQQTVPLPVGGLAYQRPFMIDTTMLYYFVEPADTVGLIGNGFDLEKRIGPFLLYKKRED